MRVEFFGAAGEVTGSNHLVHVGDKRILLDCGMIQGGRDERKRNAAAFGFDAARIDAMVLSHAHIDHVGRLPLLVKRGFRAPIFTQRATAELSRVMLEDAARLAESDTAQENRRRQRRGLKPISPLYDGDDVRKVLRLLEPMPYDEEREILPGVRVKLRDAGHILGAAIVELWGGDRGHARKLVFSGDIGPRGTPILRDPTFIDSADMVMLESTYGDRLHRNRADTVRELGEAFKQARQEGGMVLIPAFAVGRSQELLYWMSQHYEEWELDRWRIVLDSPMAAKVVDIYERHTELFDEQTLALWRRQQPFKMRNLEISIEPDQSRLLNEQRGGCIIIAGSGMCNGGRIVHHLRHHLWRPNTHVIFVGYQAAGTLGRELVDGAKSVHIFGEKIIVKAQRHTVGGLSAHADQAGLLEWYGHINGRPPVYLVHGEDKARGVLAERLKHDYGCAVTLTQPGMSAEV